jgi:RimJ/RimL family protein N-acetyltransferase
MEGYPKSVRLRDGGEVIVRPLEPADREALLAFFRGLQAEDRLFLKEDVTDPAVVQRFFEELDYERVFPIVAWHGVRIVGDGTLHRQRRGWTRHVGEVRVVVARQFQRHGLAKVLVRELVARAQAVGLEKIEAQVLADQRGALRAFESLGFEREAVRRGHARDLAGHARDLVLLTNTVRGLWGKMEDLILDHDERPLGG